MRRSRMLHLQKTLAQPSENLISLCRLLEKRKELNWKTLIGKDRRQLDFVENDLIKIICKLKTLIRKKF